MYVSDLTVRIFFADKFFLFENDDAVAAVSC